MCERILIRPGRVDFTLNGVECKGDAATVWPADDNVIQYSKSRWFPTIIMAMFADFEELTAEFIVKSAMKLFSN